MSKSRLDWHFVDYPDEDTDVLVKYTDGNLSMAVWDGTQWISDLAKVNEGTILEANYTDDKICCWANIYGVPSTETPMPAYRG